MPQEPVHLIVARNVFEPKQIKYFIAHALKWREKIRS